MLNRNPSEENGVLAPEDDDSALRLLRRARGLRGLDPEQLRRIAARLGTPVSSNRGRGLVPVVATAAFLFFAGTAVAWATGTLQRLPIIRTLLSSRTAPPRTPRASSAVARPTLEASKATTAEAKIAGDREELEAPPPSAVLPTAVLPVARHRAGSARPPLPRADSSDHATAPPAAESPIVREGESFANVLGRWRRAHDGRAALAALDVHDRSFPGGQMALESRLLRVEILLSERRDREALGILDAMPLGKMNVPRESELLTTRGELRITAGRCDDGRADLAAAGGSGALANRARNALSHCR